MPSEKRGMIPEKLFCHLCDKRLTKKTARLVEGKLWCSKCLFPPLDKRKIVA